MDFMNVLLYCVRSYYVTSSHNSELTPNLTFCSSNIFDPAVSRSPLILLFFDLIVCEYITLSQNSVEIQNYNNCVQRFYFHPYFQ